MASATTLLSLPPPLILRIFGLLPVDCRLRCAEVCRGWRSVLAERSAWTRLDVSLASGMYPMGRPLSALLRCASARAGGALQSLRVDTHVVDVHEAALLEMLAANAGALRELRVIRGRHDSWLRLPTVETLLRAAPQVRVLTADGLACDDAEAARRALRNEAPFAPLRVTTMAVVLQRADDAAVADVAADVAAHPSLTGLTLVQAPLHLPGVLDAVISVALARRLRSVSLQHCHPSPTFAPALARLLSSDALTRLELCAGGALDVPAARVLAAALRANATLTSLTLDNVSVWHEPAATAELLGALTGHASLRSLRLHDEAMDAAEQAVVGTALGALVAANAPALTELDVVRVYGLGDAAVRPVLNALPSNTRLRTLCYAVCDVSDAFAASVLLPAVRANTSLRELDLGWHGAAMLEVDRITSTRARADA